MMFMFLAVSWVVRYRYLNMYSRLPPEPQRKEPEIDLFPAPPEEGIKPGLANYLDEFMSAIKIFGYLERPVFHELTRSMQTRTLIAGETLNLEEEKGFCLVVDGMVEIFVKSSRDKRWLASTPHVGPLDDMPSSEDEEFTPGQQRYQLLTEVRNGAPMSSLFSIMSLFTEDIPMRLPEDDSSEPGTASASAELPRYPLSATFPKPHDAPISFPGTPHMEGSGHTSSVTLMDPPTLYSPRESLASIPPMSLDGMRSSKPLRPVPRRNATSSAHPDIIGRATVDTTIAIIPASAFRRLIRIYPKATSHIVHVILSRFQRVTLATAYDYLGLTGEVLQIERSMLKYTMRDLPNHLRADALDRLKEKFNREIERIGEEHGDLGKGIALHNSHMDRRRRSGTTLRKEAALQAFSRQRQRSNVGSSSIPYERSGVVSPSPGDLLSGIQASRTGGLGPSNLSAPQQEQQKGPTSPLAQRAFVPFATPRNLHSSLDKRESLDEDNLFRECILECMFKSLGLSASGHGNGQPESAQPSPRLVSLDKNGKKAVFTNNAFGGFMDPLGPSHGDTESVTSSGLAVPPPMNPHALAQDMRSDVEIVFFPQGSVLVEQGERNPGLYYVIDGFLDICVQVDESSSSSSDLLHASGKTALNAMESALAADTGARSGRGAASVKSGDSSRKPKLTRRSVALIKPGGLAGYVGTISSYRSFIDVVAKTDVYVGFLPLSSIERIVDRYPIVLLTMAKRLANLLPRLILHIDFALEWVQVDAGEVIFHEGTESEAIHIVLNGRLRLYQDRKDGGIKIKAEYGQGESIGELEVLTETSRSGTLHAIRDTEIVKFPRTLFNSLAQEHPNITIKISKIIASRMRALMDDPTLLASKDAASGSAMNKSASTLNLRTVAILPITAGVPVVEFANRLMNALAQVGTPNGATSLNQAAILNHLGKHAFNKMGKLKLAQYLADLEEKYGLVVYVAGKNSFVLPRECIEC